MDYQEVSGVRDLLSSEEILQRLEDDIGDSDAFLSAFLFDSEPQVNNHHYSLFYQTVMADCIDIIRSL